MQITVEKEKDTVIDKTSSVPEELFKQSFIESEMPSRILNELQQSLKIISKGKGRAMKIT
ncbi:hypothetical protein BpHYR1_021689 [Brachionus plicatilis]|uniref:Uncharacterized protein n=1 Tax=Brachionus plicatilis TaxID=10195 RepID=A0A3M7RVC4_BRAPC|nr:hypothetical protein BpHYR1_021689 [Brachionus plicatilis]